MPRYNYTCDVCDIFFETSHSMQEKLTTCKVCEGETLRRIPSLPFRSTVPKQKAGAIVKDFIESTREEILQQKREMTKGHLDE